MATKKNVDLSGLVATKGQAQPVANVPARAAAPESESNSMPLNFRVPGEFRRRFRTFAAERDLKLNELLRLAFDEYEKNHG